VEEEKTVLKIYPSWFYYMFFILLAAVLLAVGLVFWGKGGRGTFAGVFGLILICAACALALWAATSRYSRRYKVTERRVLSVEGLLSRKASEVEIKDIRNIQISQSFLERLFRIGTVSIGTAGTAGVEITLRGIPDPTRARDVIRERRGAIENQ